MRKTVLPLLAMLALTVGADARLGETSAECRERYGVMALEPNPQFPALPNYTARKNEFKITIRFVDGKAAWISYDSAEAISREIIDSLLDLNAEDSKWTFNEALAERTAEVAGKDARYTRKDRKADATYEELGSLNRLTIITSAYRQATHPELKGL